MKDESKRKTLPSHISHCPTCDPKIINLGKNLPNAHLEQTAITCRVSKTLMNESNPPLFLPTGYIISEDGR